MKSYRHPRCTAQCNRPAKVDWSRSGIRLLVGTIESLKFLVIKRGFRYFRKLPAKLRFGRFSYSALIQQRYHLENQRLKHLFSADKRLFYVSILAIFLRALKNFFFHSKNDFYSSFVSFIRFKCFWRFVNDHCNSTSTSQKVYITTLQHPNKVILQPVQTGFCAVQKQIAKDHHTERVNMVPNFLDVIKYQSMLTVPRGDLPLHA